MHDPNQRPQEPAHEMSDAYHELLQQELKGILSDFGERLSGGVYDAIVAGQLEGRVFGEADTGDCVRLSLGDPLNPAEGVEALFVTNVFDDTETSLDVEPWHISMVEWIDSLEAIFRKQDPSTIGLTARNDEMPLELIVYHNLEDDNSPLTIYRLHREGDGTLRLEIEHTDMEARNEKAAAEMAVALAFATSDNQIHEISSVMPELRQSDPVLSAADTAEHQERALGFRTASLTQAQELRQLLVLKEPIPAHTA